MTLLWHSWLGGRKGIQPVKNWVVGCWRGYVSGARCRLACCPADATATHCLLLQQNPDCFTFLVPAHPDSPGKRAVKRACVWVCVLYALVVAWLCFDTVGWVTWEASSLWKLLPFLPKDELHLSNRYDWWSKLNVMLRMCIAVHWSRLQWCSGMTFVCEQQSRQIETRTRDGRRRITPIFIAPQPDVGSVPYCCQLI